MQLESVFSWRASRRLTLRPHAATYAMLLQLFTDQYGDKQPSLSAVNNYEN